MPMRCKSSSAVYEGAGTDSKFSPGPCPPARSSIATQGWDPKLPLVACPSVRASCRALSDEQNFALTRMCVFFVTTCGPIRSPPNLERPKTRPRLHHNFPLSVARVCMHLTTEPHNQHRVYHLRLSCVCDCVCDWTVSYLCVNVNVEPCVPARGALAPGCIPCWQLGACPGSAVSQYLPRLKDLGKGPPRENS